MGLVVPVLRFFFLFLNIYDTFKVLKLPRPSARNGGQPSIRAMTQRKRDMKGVMTIWIVWCCYATYERTADSAISILVPFYDEVKSLFLLFFIFTRARGAEPVYLHVIRPLVKPYTTTLDAILDTTHLVGDFLLILLAWPWHSAVAWYRRWKFPWVNSDDDVQSLSSSSASSQDVRLVPAPNESEIRSRGYSSAMPENPAAVAARQARLQFPQSHTSNSEHELWFPPPPAYEEEQSDNDGFPHFSVRLDHPQPSIHVRLPPDDTVDDEWRKYPDFPSAYPPTPIAPPKSFRIVAPVPKRPSDIIHFAEISEEEYSDSQTEECCPREKREILEPKTGDSQQGFPRSLLEPRESMNPDSDRHLSDDDPMVGVQIFVQDDGEGSEEEEGDETMNTTLQTPRASLVGKGEEELVMDIDISDNDFGLKTPMQLRTKQIQLKPRPESMLSVPSTSSWQSRSTTLDTNDDTSSLRTRERSDSESSRQLSDSSSLAGRKRPLPHSRSSQSTLRPRVRAETMSRSSSSGDAIAKPFQRRGAPQVQVRSGAKPGVKRIEDEVDSTSEVSVAKKRKIVATTIAPRIRKNPSAPTLTSLPIRKSTSSTVKPVRRSARNVVSAIASSTKSVAGKAVAGS